MVLCTGSMVIEILKKIMAIWMKKSYDEYITYSKNYNYWGETMVAHEIEYKLHGDDMQFVEIELDPGESAIAEAGAMMMMDDGIEMETVFGDGSNQSKGLLGKLVGAGKRLITGESLFMTVFTNHQMEKKTCFLCRSVSRKNYSA